MSSFHAIQLGIEFDVTGSSAAWKTCGAQIIEAIKLLADEINASPAAVPGPVFTSGGDNLIGYVADGESLVWVMDTFLAFRERIAPVAFHVGIGIGWSRTPDLEREIPSQSMVNPLRDMIRGSSPLGATKRAKQRDEHVCAMVHGSIDHELDKQVRRMVRAFDINDARMAKAAREAVIKRVDQLLADTSIPCPYPDRELPIHEIVR